MVKTRQAVIAAVASLLLIGGMVYMTNEIMDHPPIDGVVITR
jgi:hypothetical protein